MDRKAWIVMVAAGLLVGTLAPPAAAQDKPAAEKPADPIEEFIQKTKNPTPWLNWGADARLREVFTPNLLLDEEDRHFQRYRFRLWTKITPVKDVAVNARLVWEPRHFCQPSRELIARDAFVIDEWTMNEAIFDLANVQWSNVLGLPLKLTVGRQEIIFGNGWLVLDGTPLDGSRTIFFDAARGTVDLKDIKSTLDLIFICQHADSDYWLPPFCDKDFHNIEQDEQGVIVYLTNKSLPKTQIDGYFIYKRDERVLGGQEGDIGAGHLAPWQQGTYADIYTFGARVAGELDEHWKYRAEFAQQFGTTDKIAWSERQELCAFGFNSQLAYFFKDPLNNNLRVGYEYLSGDNAGTESTNEQFDPLWGRWPQFSELLAYTVALDNRPGETTNMHRVGMGWSCNPMKKMEVLTDYHVLFTDKNTFRDRAYFSDSGCLRGQLLTAVMKYKFSEHVATHVWAEMFFPGDYYSDLNNDVAGFFRYELVFTW